MTAAIHGSLKNLTYAAGGRGCLSKETAFAASLIGLCAVLDIMSTLTKGIFARSEVMRVRTDGDFPAARAEHARRHTDHRPLHAETQHASSRWIVFTHARSSCIASGIGVSASTLSVSSHCRLAGGRSRDHSSSHLRYCDRSHILCRTTSLRSRYLHQALHRTSQCTASRYSPNRTILQSYSCDVTLATCQYSPAPLW